MSDFGCFYNPRPEPGRCIKDTQSNNVDSQCEVSGGSCKLKGTRVMKGDLILVPTPVTAKINQTIVTSSLVNSKLSGPVTAYSGTDSKNVSYYLFSDIHFSLENECKDPCKIMGMETFVPGSENCWDIARLMSDIFKRSKDNNQYVDFYIEIPFLPKIGYKPPKNVVKQMIPSTGEIDKIYYIFYDCFNKVNCPYDNVRFHYADVRLQYNPSDTWASTSVPMLKDIYFQEYIFERVNDCLIILKIMIEKNRRTKNQYIDITDKLMKILYYTGGQTMMGYEKPLHLKLFELYLLSDNYDTDVMKLISPILEEIPDVRTASKIKDAFIVRNILVNRGDKTMHRSRTQLEALENEGQQELADKIKAYVFDQYMKNLNNSTLMALWNKFMELYNSFVNPRSRVMGDEVIALEILIKEYKSFKKFSDLNISSAALLMDAYILSRMFRTFPGSSHKVSNKRIIYAGAAHIETYVDFLSKYLNVKFTRYGATIDKINQDFEDDSINRCFDIDIEKFQ